MRVYYSVLLSGMLILGVAANSQAIEVPALDQSQSDSALQSIAHIPTKSDADNTCKPGGECRREGYLGVEQSNTSAQSLNKATTDSNQLRADAEQIEPHRGSGRFGS